MIEISKNELKNILKHNLHDFCMLLPFLEESYTYENAKCFISSVDSGNFLCRFEDFDGNVRFEICWNDKDINELRDTFYQLVPSGEFSVAFYKRDLVELLDESTCRIISKESIFSYFAKAEKRVFDDVGDMRISSEIDNELLSEDFVSQTGNHINIIHRQTEMDKDNNKVLYLVSHNKLMGYIALSKQYENFWDVAYIFVDESERFKGYGAYLCDCVKAKLAEEGKVMFYSYPENEGSTRVAIKSGLSVCAERFVYNLKY